MRPFCAIGLLAALAALAGCGSSPTYSPAPNAPSTFHEKPANKTLTEEQLPLKYFDKDGKEVDLADFRKQQKNVVLVVVKGFDPRFGDRFCPGCLAHANSLAASHKEFEKRDAQIVMLFPGRTDKLPQFLTDAKVDPLPFPVLADTDLKAVTALGIANTDIKQALPSTYILDKQGKVAFAYVADTSLPDVTFDRPSVKSLLDQLDKLNAKK